MEVRLHETDAFRFAGFPFGRVPVVVSPRGWSNMAPESPAAKIGLRPGDQPVEPDTEGPLDLEAFIAKVEAGEPVTVARPRGRRQIETVLPSP